jgi:2-polyprenyl-3-methyl-5-hydroxy-6-metoxy-1,4-benzoquinol methylase
LPNMWWRKRWGAMQQIFDRYIEHSFGEARQSSARIKQFAFNYRQYFPLNLGAKVLDIGVGRGEMLACMKEWGYLEYQGVDISADTIRFCQSMGLQCQQVDDTGAWLLEHAGEFDLITLLDVLEHFKKEQIIDFLKVLRGALKSQGVLIIQVPNMQAPDSQLHRYNDITHECGFIEHSLLQVLLAAGFKEIAFFGFEELITGRKDTIKRFLRPILWSYVRFVRIVNGNLCPRILNPVFYAVIRND